MDPHNVSLLIESQQDAILPEKCLEYYVTRPDEANFSKSVYFGAAWFLFRNFGKEKLPKGFNFRELLLWASQFAYDKLNIKASLDPQKATHSLQELLVEETAVIMLDKRYYHSKDGLTIKGIESIGSPAAYYSLVLHICAVTQSRA
jgi:hypothetical protein